MRGFTSILERYCPHREHNIAVAVRRDPDGSVEETCLYARSCRYNTEQPCGWCGVNAPAASAAAAGAAGADASKENGPSFRGGR